MAGGSWPGIISSPDKAVIEKILPAYIRERRWFGGKARRISKLKISGAVPLGDGSMPLAFLEVAYSGGTPQTYLLPLAWKEEAAAAGIVRMHPGAAIARLELSGKRGLLYDAVYDKTFHSAFLSLFFGGKRPHRGREELVVERNRPLLKKALVVSGLPREARVLKGEQSNTSIVYGSAYFTKLYRRLENGVNPDVEIGARLTRGGAFRSMPPFLGAVSLHRGGKFYGAIGLLQGYTPSRGDSWTYALGQVSRYYKRVLAGLASGSALRLPSTPAPGAGAVPPMVGKLIGRECLALMSLLGRRTAEMHVALSSAGKDPDFRPEPFSLLYQRSAYRSMVGLASSSMRLLSKKLKDLPAAVKPGASLLLKNKQAVLESFRAITDRRFPVMKIRIHGDFHLGQVLFTGKDFVIIDFEGEPAKPLGERRLKRSALCDVAGMLRSFHYAALAPFCLHKDIPAGKIPLLEPWAELWYSYVSDAFLKAYFKSAAGAEFLPEDPAETAALLKVFLMEKAVYELSYELNNRPDWVSIPLKGLLQASVARGLKK
jgi:maltose alpha-D-glucosyltransferase/alpha-amylase